mmetsp:Transcript_24788/g.54852  ORF Transcript_24788/g.54852 Transcript_24788/m.54852 type:complete len:255 (-) Transcript_24788:741-1505(-)
MIRCRYTSRSQHGWRQINIQRQLLINRPHHIRRHSRIPNDKRHPYALLMGIPLIGQSMFGVVVAIIGREYNEGPIELPLQIQLLQYQITSRIHLACHSIIILHHVLLLIGCLIPPPPSGPALVVICKEFRQSMVTRQIIIRWIGYNIILVHIPTLILDEILSLITIDGMSGKEGNIGKEGLVPWPRFQKSQCIRLILFGHVPQPSPPRIVMPSILLHLKVRSLLVRMIDTPLPDMTDVISTLFLHQIIYRLIPI